MKHHRKHLLLVLAALLLAGCAAESAGPSDATSGIIDAHGREVVWPSMDVGSGIGNTAGDRAVTFSLAHPTSERNGPSPDPWGPSPDPWNQTNGQPAVTPTDTKDNSGSGSGSGGSDDDGN